jgi:signal transduction histidine kinase
MTIRTRLLGAFAAVTVLFGLPLLYGIARLQDVRAIATTLQGSHAEAYAALGQLRAFAAEFDRHARSYVITPDPVFRSRLAAALARGGRSRDRLAGAGFSELAAKTGVWLDSLDATTVRLETLVERGRVDEATEWLGTGVQPALAQLYRTVDENQVAVTTASGEAAAQAREISARTIRAAIGSALLVLALAAGVVWWAVAAVSRPLRRLKTSTASVARGAFVAPADLPYARDDEIGDLSRSFRSMTERLAELDRLRADFLNVVSHDLKAPLNLINGYAELIEEDAPADLPRESRRLLVQIREHARTLTERVNRLLSIGRLEARAYPVHPEPLPVPPLFHSVRRAYEPQARRQNLTFLVNIEPSAPPFVLVDPECFHHEVIGNLLGNAFKYTPGGGRVTLRVWGEGAPRALHFCVEDTGPGIPPADLPHVFDKYYQAGRHASLEGSGLGLAIARELVEVQGGTIAIPRSTADGTVVHVTLPAAETARTPRHTPGGTRLPLAEV